MRISIAMAVKNAAAFLPEALASIPASLGSAGADYEIVIADGGSTDGTLDIAVTAPNARIVSRADAGLYDGMNRAIAAATGDAVLLLNGDDLLLPGALGLAIDTLSRHPDRSFASSPALFGRSPADATLRRHRGPISTEGVLFGVPAINARVFRTGLLSRLGPIRTDVGLGADRDLLLRLVASGARGVPVAEPLYFYRSHVESRTLAGTREGTRRVYDANVALAHDIIARTEVDQGLRKLARASLAVEQLKLRLTGGQGWESRQTVGRPSSLARGLWLAMRWRGVLSGT